VEKGDINEVRQAWLMLGQQPHKQEAIFSKVLAHLEQSNVTYFLSARDFIVEVIVASTHKDDVRYLRRLYEEMERIKTQTKYKGIARCTFEVQYAIEEKMIKGGHSTR